MLSCDASAQSWGPNRSRPAPLASALSLCVCIISPLFHTSVLFMQVWKLRPRLGEVARSLGEVVSGSLHGQGRRGGTRSETHSGPATWAGSGQWWLLKATEGDRVLGPLGN